MATTNEVKTYVCDIKTILFIGSLLALLSYLPGTGRVLSIIGGIVYLYGLYRWKELVDERSFKLALLIFVISIFQVVAVLILLRAERIALSITSFSKLIFVYTILNYPFVALIAILRRIILENFYEVTGEENFLTSRELLLYAILLYPVIVGSIIGIVANVYELLGYKNMPEAVTPVRGRKIEINKRETIALLGASFLISGLLIYALVPKYDFEIEKGNVVFYGEISGDFIDGIIIYKEPCPGSKICIEKVEVDGEIVYSAPSYEKVNNKQVVRISIPKSAEKIRVLLAKEGEVIIEVPTKES
ncbi:hypothetical protein [Pyrococcus woesei]|uniref:hypothetical protein n=1 Tax=Pyrococcus woesei TaxID=2262 RepID=UPI003D2EAA51